MSDSSVSKSTEAAPAPGTTTPSAETKALQPNKLPSQDAASSQDAAAPSEQPSQQAAPQATAKPGVSAKDSKATGAQQQQPAPTAPVTKAEQKQPLSESNAKQGSGATAAKAESAATSSAGGAWGGAKSFRDIAAAAGNKPEKVGLCLMVVQAQQAFRSAFASVLTSSVLSCMLGTGLPWCDIIAQL